MTRPDTSPDDDRLAWQAATFEGARREQLRRWSRLSLREILLALEEMEELGQRLGAAPPDSADSGVSSS